MDAWSTAQSLLPETLLNMVRQVPAAEEIRLRLGKPPAVVISGREERLAGGTVTQQELLHILEKATGASLYAAAPSLKNGFVSYRGLRIGVCGEAVYTRGQLSGLRGFSSLAVRVPHEKPLGCEALLDGMLRAGPESTLIVSPPGGGKTSLLRELIRRASAKNLRVSVIDDRNELSASVSGRAQFDLGPGSDVLVGVPKAQAAGQETDLSAAEQITGCGVVLFATAHGRDLQDLQRRKLYRTLLESGVFRELVTIACKGGKRVYTREALP